MPMRIFIADRDDELLAAYAAYLSADGFEVLTATTLARCAEEMDGAAPDVLVLDPDLSCGYDAGLRFLSVLLGKLVPVVLLTAPEDRVGAAAGLPYAAEACYSKPLPPARLAELLRAIPLTRRMGAGRAARRQALVAVGVGTP
jgi:DNA-binding response OmpR family regulator